MGTKLIVLTATVVCLCAYLYMFENHRSKVLKLLNTCPLHWFGSPSKQSGNDAVSFIRLENTVLMTKEELSAYTGADGSPGLYLGILGRVYDVSAKPHMYGPEGGYGFFAGKDGTKAYMSGEFNEKGLIDEVSGLTNGQMIELENWIDFYEKNYIYIGKVIGNFYDEEGKPREPLYEAQRMLEEAHVAKSLQEEERKRFPPCNSRWRQQDGFATVSCSDKSGGIKRDWVGVPRKLFTQKTNTTRCVCVKNSGPPLDDLGAKTDVGDLNHPHLEEYESCHPDSVECDFIPDNQKGKS